MNCYMLYMEISLDFENYIHSVSRDAGERFDL